MEYNEISISYNDVGAKYILQVNAIRQAKK